MSNKLQHVKGLSTAPGHGEDSLILDIIMTRTLILRIEVCLSIKITSMPKVSDWKFCMRDYILLFLRAKNNNANNALLTLSKSPTDSPNIM